MLQRPLSRSRGHVGPICLLSHPARCTSLRYLWYASVGGSVDYCTGHEPALPAGWAIHAITSSGTAPGAVFTRRHVIEAADPPGPAIPPGPSSSSAMDIKRKADRLAMLAWHNHVAEADSICPQRTGSHLSPSLMWMEVRPRCTWKPGGSVGSSKRETRPTGRRGRQQNYRWH